MELATEFIRVHDDWAAVIMSDQNAQDLIEWTLGLQDAIDNGILILDGSIWRGYDLEKATFATRSDAWEAFKRFWRVAQRDLDRLQKDYNRGWQDAKEPYGYGNL